MATYRATDFSDQMLQIAQAGPAPDDLRLCVAAAQTVLDGGSFDTICAFNFLYLLDDLPSLLRDIFRTLQTGGLLISKTWCFGDLGRRPRFLFAVRKVVGCSHRPSC